MIRGKKKSTFITQDSVPDDHFIDTFGAGVNRKIPKPKFFKQIRDEAQTFIYENVVDLQAANLEADPDDPVYVRVAETGFWLYQITSLAATALDIVMDNGTTATRIYEKTAVIPLNDITSLSSLNTAALVDEQQLSRGEFWPGTGVGAVNIKWDPNEPVANHNGGTIIDPAKISELNTTTKTFGTYFTPDTVSGNTGCFVVVDQLVSPSVYTFGAFPSSVSGDPTPAVVAALSYIDASGAGGVLHDGGMGGELLISDPLEATTEGVKVIGSGRKAFIFTATHSDGPAFRFKRQFSGLIGVTVGASADRRDGVAGQNMGVLFEAEDVVDDPSIRLRQCILDDVTITDQPFHASVWVGPVLDGSKITQLRAFNNKGHAIAIDRGFITGRVNKPDPLVPGLITIEDSLSFGNSGHAVAAGNPADTISTPALRLVVSNFDSGQTATDAAIRYSEEDFYIDGTNHDFSTITTSRSGSGGAIRVSGRNNHFKNLRVINADHSVRVANRAALPTDGIYVTGITALTKTQPVAVIVEPGAKNVSVHNRTMSNITQLISDLSPGSEIISPVKVMATESNQVVNNSTAFVDIAGLAYAIDAGEKIKYRANLMYTGASAADIKFTTGGSGSSYLRFGASGGVKLDTGDTVIGDTVKNTFGDPVVYGAASSERMAVIEGYLEQATAATITLRFAQLVADPSDTTVLEGSTFEVQRILK